jgi:hypothetical protein
LLPPVVQLFFHLKVLQFHQPSHLHPAHLHLLPQLQQNKVVAAILELLLVQFVVLLLLLVQDLHMPFSQKQERIIVINVFTVILVMITMETALINLILSVITVDLLQHWQLLLL